MNSTIQVVRDYADLDHLDVDPRRGFLAVIDRLAGRARSVKIATHDTRLGVEALRRLVSARTPCEWELLVGLPLKSSIHAARQAGVPVRIYVPYGYAHLPYRVRDSIRHPHMAGGSCTTSCAAVPAAHFHFRPFPPVRT